MLDSRWNSFETNATLASVTRELPTSPTSFPNNSGVRLNENII